MNQEIYCSRCHRLLHRFGGATPDGTLPRVLTTGACGRCDSAGVPRTPEKDTPDDPNP